METARVQPVPQLQSAVRLPTPETEQPSICTSVSTKRKRSPSSHSPSQTESAAPGNVRFNGIDERELLLRERFQRREEVESSAALTQEEKQAKAKEEYNKLLSARSGGTYIPPARLKALQGELSSDKSSKEFQRMAWDALRKSINGLVNKVSIANIKAIAPEIFQENLVRGRGLFCRSIMKAQAASLPFTPIYSALVAIVNTKLPQVGELLVKRLVNQWKKAWRRNDRTVLKSSTTFIAHLVNQQVVHELLSASLLQLLLSKPTDDSVEIAVGLMREVGQHLESFSGPIALLVMDQFRNILHEAEIDKRTQYMIEVLFQVRKDKYKDNPAVKEELDLVEEEDQITHHPPSLDEALDTEDGLNIFKYDTNYEENEQAYAKLRAEILGEQSDSDDEGTEADSAESSEVDEDDEKERQMDIKDQTNAELTNLRRKLYLTLNSSAGFEEAAHKLMRLDLPVGKESELPSMIIEAASQRPAFEPFYANIAERFARLNRMWLGLFEEQFVKYYETIHRYETNRLRNIARLFAALLSSDAIGWHVFSIVHLNEEETTSSSRIYLKIIMNGLVEEMGMKKLQERLSDPILQPSLEGMLPKDNPRNTRFSVNYFTSIGMGPITEDMREFLKNMPKPILPAITATKKDDSDSDSDSVSSYSTSSSYSGSSRSRSGTHSDSRSRSRSLSRAPLRRSENRRDASPAQVEGIGRRKRSPGSENRSRARGVPPRDLQQRRGRSLRRSESRSPSPRRNKKGNTAHGKSRRGPNYSSYSRSRTRSVSEPRSRPRRNVVEQERKARSISSSRSRSPPELLPSRRRGRSLSRSRSRRSPRDPRGNEIVRGRQIRHDQSASTSRSDSRSPPPRRSGRDDVGRNKEKRNSPGRGKRNRSSDSLSQSTSSRSVSRSKSPPPRESRSGPFATLDNARNGNRVPPSNFRDEKHAPPAKRRRFSSHSRSLSPGSRSRSPLPVRKGDKSVVNSAKAPYAEPANGAGERRERSLSPYSKRVALTKQGQGNATGAARPSARLRGEGDGTGNDGGPNKPPGGGRVKNRPKAGDFM